MALPLLKAYNRSIRGLSKKPPCERLNYNKETPMSISLCTVDGCEKKHLAKGYCAKHYQRNKINGTPHITTGHTLHGKCYSPEYRTWRSIKERVASKNCKSYDNYGGRGIKMCDKWFNSFEIFYTDMGERPSDKHTIERIDNSKGYEPENCIWASRTVQNINKRVQKNNTSGVRGVKHSHGKWVAQIGVNRSRIWLGAFVNFDDAVIARKQAEEKYFKPLLTEHRSLTCHE